MSSDDVVISHIQSMMDCGHLRPGDRVPSERKLAETLGVTRAHVRLALQKLEFQGVVQTQPQSGTYIKDYDFSSLVHVRTLLETDAVRLCALNRNEKDIEQISAALKEYEENFNSSLKVEKDLALHLSVAVGSHNPVLASLLQRIAPDVMTYYHRYQVCSVPDSIVIEEHRNIVEAIIAGDADKAESCLLLHFKSITEFANSSR